MAIPFFDPTNHFWRWFARVMDVFGLSLCWLVCSIPLLTMGASTTALYDSISHCIRRGEDGPYARFFRTFRRELKTGILITVPALVVFVIYYLMLGVSYITANGGNTGALLLVYVYQFVFLVLLVIWVTACAVLSRFTFGAGQLLSTALKLTFSNLLRMVLVGVVLVFGIATAMWMPLTLMVLPGLAALLISYPMEKVFAPFLPKEEEADGEEEA